MADVQSEQITMKQALAYLRSALPKHSCRLCGGDELEPIVEDDQIHVAQVHISSRGLRFFPVVAFVCNRCGDLSQFSWPKIKNWIDNTEGAARG